MNLIGLEYINSGGLITLLSNDKISGEELYNELWSLIVDDYSLAVGYINKYDNKYDALETDVSLLKKQIENVNNNLKKIKEIQYGS